jgi:hypothetical protein
MATPKEPPPPAADQATPPATPLEIIQARLHEAGLKDAAIAGDLVSASLPAESPDRVAALDAARDALGGGTHAARLRQVCHPDGYRLIAWPVLTARDALAGTQMQD